MAIRKHKELMGGLGDSRNVSLGEQHATCPFASYA
jgi:hypothetical protein